MSPAAYRVEFARPARRGLGRLPDKVAAAAIEFCVGPLAANPHRVGTPLTRELDGLHAARRGTYRIVHRIDDTLMTIAILRIEHRRDAYRPR